MMTSDTIRDLTYVAERAGFSDVDLSIDELIEHVKMKAVDPSGMKCSFWINFIPDKDKPQFTSRITPEERLEEFSNCIEACSKIEWSDPVSAIYESAERRLCKKIKFSQPYSDAICISYAPSPFASSFYSSYCEYSIIIFLIDDIVRNAVAHDNIALRTLFIDAGYRDVSLLNSDNGRSLTVTATDVDGFSHNLICRGYQDQKGFSSAANYISAPFLRMAIWGLSRLFIKLDWANPLESLKSNDELSLGIATRLGISTFTFNLGFRASIGCLFDARIELDRDAFLAFERREKERAEKERLEFQAFENEGHAAGCPIQTGNLKRELSDQEQEFSDELAFIAECSGFTGAKVSFEEGMNPVLLLYNDSSGSGHKLQLELTASSPYEHMSADDHLNLLGECIRACSEIDWADPLTTFARKGLKDRDLYYSESRESESGELIIRCKPPYPLSNFTYSITFFGIKSFINSFTSRANAALLAPLLEAGYYDAAISDRSTCSSLLVTASSEEGERYELVCRCNEHDNNESLPSLGLSVPSPHLRDAAAKLIDAFINMDWNNPLESLKQRDSIYGYTVKLRGASTYVATIGIQHFAEFDASIRLNRTAYTLLGQRTAKLAEEKKAQDKREQELKEWADAQIKRHHEKKIKISVDEMSGHEFEAFCAKLLEANGYGNVKVTKGSGDQGIDVLATRDGVRFGIQCKCYAGEVGNSAVREAFAGRAFYGCHVAIVMTNSSFTKAARDAASGLGVVLWDREKLDELIVSANL